MKKTRVKSSAAPMFVPQSKEQVADAIREIGERNRELLRIEADMNDEIAKIKEAYERDAEPHRDRLKALNAGAQIWCEANRDALTNAGKVKTALFATGEVAWRTRPPSVVVRGAEAVIDRLRRLGLARFVRTKDEVNKEAILAEPASVSHVEGIQISQGEDFVITPFETVLQQ